MATRQCRTLRTLHTTAEKTMSYGTTHGTRQQRSATISRTEDSELTTSARTTRAYMSANALTTSTSTPLLSTRTGLPVLTRADSSILPHHTSRYVMQRSCSTLLRQLQVQDSSKRPRAYSCRYDRERATLATVVSMASQQASRHVWPLYSTSDR